MQYVKFIGFSLSVYSLLFFFFCVSLHVSLVVVLLFFFFFYFIFFFLLLCRGHCPFSILLASCGTFLASDLVLGVLFMREMLSNFPKTCNVFGCVACVCVSLALSLSLSLALFGATSVCGNYKLLFWGYVILCTCLCVSMCASV